METDYLSLLCSTTELSALVAGSTDVDTFLQRLTAVVARRLQADVCSVYVYQEDTDDVVLRATVGLKAEAVGTVRMRSGEGLVGTAIKTLRPVIEEHASQSADYKYFPVTGEEPFESFLAVPVARGVQRFGVLVVQRKENVFTDDDVMAVRAIGTQLAGMMENARMLLEVHAAPESRTRAAPQAEVSVVNGEAAAEGCAMAPLRLLLPADSPILNIFEEQLDRPLTIEDFGRAVEATARQIQEVQDRLAESLPEMASLVFAAHLMMLNDSQFGGAMGDLIEGGANPCDAVLDVASRYMQLFAASPQAHMREKAGDVRDLARHLLRNLFEAGEDLPADSGGCVIAAQDLGAADIVKLWSEGVQGVVLIGGGATGHVGIIARSLHLPLIVTEDRSLLSVPEHTPVLLDAFAGDVYVNPGEDVIRRLEDRRRAGQVAEAAGADMKDETRTRDGERVHLLANINLLSEVPVALDLKAEGVGLYRTEFPFLIRPNFPSEAEQIVTYRSLLRQMDGRPVTFRTLDVGGDKVLSYYDHGHDANPALGLRSIRFSLLHEDIFEMQLRAVLRAGAGATGLRVMFPMIGSIEEFRAARAVLQRSIEALCRRGVACCTSPSVGIMVELPAIAETMDAFAAEADFFSIGTNDFVQYMLAADRANAKVASYYCPHHPGVLRALARIARAAVDAGKDISVCGEMAHQAAYIPFLLGIGIRKLSVNPQFLPAVQAQIGGISVSEAEQLAAAMLAENSVEGVASAMGEVAPV